MILAVLDTNILVSALINGRGTPAQVFLTVLFDTDMRLCVSAEIYAEYEEVLRRPRLRRSEAEVDGALRAIRECAIWVRPGKTVRVCLDPDDDIFLECAEAAGAQYIVTGNLRHFPRVWAEAQVVTARQFLDAV